jgi:hypothetical protein
MRQKKKPWFKKSEMHGDLPFKRYCGKCIKDNWLRAMLVSALPTIAGGRAMRAIDLGDVGPIADYRDTYSEGGGHSDTYKDNYSETGYKDHYSDTRHGMVTRLGYPAEPLSRDALIREADLLRTELAAKNAMIERLRGGSIG